MPSPHIPPSPGSLLIKAEPVEKTDDQPLDFSLKPSREPDIKMEPKTESQFEMSRKPEGHDDSPMDLSVKKSPMSANPLAIAPKVWY